MNIATCKNCLKLVIPSAKGMCPSCGNDVNAERVILIPPPNSSRNKTFWQTSRLIAPIFYFFIFSTVILQGLSLRYASVFLLSDAGAPGGSYSGFGYIAAIFALLMVQVGGSATSAIALFLSLAKSNKAMKRLAVNSMILAIAFPLILIAFGLIVLIS